MRRSDFRERAARTYFVLERCSHPRFMASWLRERVLDAGKRVSQKTIYNWLNGCVEIPDHAWKLLARLEADARAELRALVRDLR